MGQPPQAQGTGMMQQQRPTLPMSIILTQSEHDELALLTRHEQSATKFWSRAFAMRSIVIPAGKVLCMKPGQRGEYWLEWHPKRLGPAAIAQGNAYRAFADKRDREFATKLQQHGREVWT